MRALRPPLAGACIGRRAGTYVGSFDVFGVYGGGTGSSVNSSETGGALTKPTQIRRSMDRPGARFTQDLAGTIFPTIAAIAGQRIGQRPVGRQEARGLLAGSAEAPRPSAARISSMPR